MPGNHVNLVAFDLPAERDLRLPVDDPFTKSQGRPLSVIGVQVQLLGDLFVREVQPHEVEEEDPGPQRLMAAGEDAPVQVVDPPPAGRALVRLPFRLGVVFPRPRDLGRVAVKATRAVGSSQGPDHLLALGVVVERLDVHRPGGPILLFRRDLRVEVFMAVGYGRSHSREMP